MPHMGSIARMDPKLPSKWQDVSWPSPPTPNAKYIFFQSERPKSLLKYQLFRAYRSYLILFFLLFAVLSCFCPTFWVMSYLSYFLGFFLLLSYFSYFFPTFPTFWDLILILILILNTLPIYILFSYFLVFSLTFLVADMKGKPNLPYLRPPKWWRGGWPFWV